MRKRLIWAVRRNRFAYIALLFLCTFVVAFQLRASLDTIHIQRTYEFYVPFVFEPFTNRIADHGYALTWETGSHPDPAQRSVVHLRDEVLSVNGHPFRGVSMYLRELWKAQHQPPPDFPKWAFHPFTLDIRSRDGTRHAVEVNFPHCTCGIPGLFEASAIWLIPPMFCLTLGFVVTSLRPSAILAWAFLVLMLSLTQIQFWPDVHSEFQQTTTPMIWRGLFRILGVGYRALIQHSWPAALFLASACFYRSRRSIYWVSVGVSALFLVAAILQAVIEIAWSENYRPFVFLYQFFAAYSTELRVISFAAVATLCWLLNSRFGLAVSALGLLAVGSLYRTPSPLTKGTWHQYSDNSYRFDTSIPAFHQTPAFITLLFVAGVVVCALVIFRRNVSLLEAISFLLCMPLASDFAARFGWYLYPLGPSFFPNMRYWFWSALALAALGLVGASWSLVRRIEIESGE